MYIGSTDARGLHHLVWEVVDNSIDEAMAGLGNANHGSNPRRWQRRDLDDGRGVPVGRQKQTVADAPAVVHTVLHAGGKFGGGGYYVGRPSRRRRQRRPMRCRSGCASKRRATARSGARTTSAVRRPHRCA